MRSPDPAVQLQAAKALGYDVERMARLAMQEGTPEAKLAAIEARQKQLEDENRQLKQTWQQRQDAEDRRSRESTFVKAVQSTIREKGGETAPRYPHLSELPPRQVLAMARTLLTEVEERQGVAYRQSLSNDEILEYLDGDIARHRSSRAKAGTAAPKTNVAKSPAHADATEKTQGQPTSRTNTQAGKAGQSPGIASLDDLPEYEQRKALAKAFAARAKPRTM
jgi:hypothetical protein